ncbi:MAG TPA: DUF5686 family protein [Draconibacterium sp.]|nr:DUF5686 family protein [Draconibacterium sp.]
MTRFFILLYLFVLLTFQLLAQPTEISGKITEKATGEPIPYASIIFRGTSVGTMSDINGSYSLKTSKPGAEIEVSSIGYQRQYAPVKFNQKNHIDFQLEEEVFSLGEIDVRPGENPANIIFRKIVENKSLNDPANFPSWKSRIYAKTEIDLKNVKSSLRDKKLMEQFDFVFNYLDSLENEGKTFLPVFLNETVSNYYHDSESNKEREEIVANKVSGTKSDVYSQFTGKMYENIKIYQNYMTFSDIGFVSPVNNLGLQFYKYYLVDSALVDGQKIYELSFRPKLPQEPVFKGNFWVEDGSFALTKLEMQLAEQANVNFINNLQYSIEYKKNDGKWVPKTESVVVDIDIQKNKDSEKMGIIARKTNIYDDFSFENVSEIVRKQKDPIVLAPNVSGKSDDFWNEARPVELQQRERNIYLMVDSIKDVKLYRTMAENLYMFAYGYRDLGKIELGPYYYVYSKNKIEGSRFRLGARTTYKFDKNLRLNGFGAYGTKDKEFKYGAGFEYYFSIKPLSVFSFQMQRDLEMLGKSDKAFSEQNIVTTLLAKRPNSKFNMIDKFEIQAKKEWRKGLHNELKLSSAKIQSSPFVPFLDSEGATIPSIKSTEIMLGLRYAPGEEIVQDRFERNVLSNFKPTFNIKLTKGFEGVLGGEFDYFKMHAGLYDKLNLNPVGFSKYYIQVGKIWGDVPFPLLKIHEGNETYSYDIYAFNLMNYQEFVSDTYASVFWEHHFAGFFLNKVPLFRKLKWREIVGTRLLWGEYNTESHSIIQLPNDMKGLGKKPYTEFSLGLENIFKFIRVDGVWRYNYNDQNKSRFGIFFSANFTL